MYVSFAGLGSIELSPAVFTIAATGVPSPLTMKTFDLSGNMRQALSVKGLKLLLQKLEAPYERVGEALSLAPNSDGGAYTVALMGTLAGRYSLSVLFNATEAEEEAGASFSGILREILVKTPLQVTVIYGEISALGSQITSDVGSKAAGWEGGDLAGYTDKIVGGFFSMESAVNKFAMAGRDRYGNQVQIGGSGALITASMTSEEGLHSATISITDLSNGFYGVSYQTTRAGWYAVQVRVGSGVVVDGNFRVFVAAGEARNSQSFACVHQGSGCYNRDRGSAALSCSRWLKSVPIGTLRCAEADDRSPALLNVRLVDRFGNEVSTPRWQDFVRYSVTASPLPANDTTKVFVEQGCFLGLTPCSSASPVRAAVQVESSGANFHSSKYAGTMVWLYPLSVVSTISGSYTIHVQQGYEDQARSTKTIVGDIANPTISFQCIPSDPFAGSSVATGPGISSGVAGKTVTFDILTRDRFHNQRVDVVEALETDMFFVELVGPAPALQTQAFPGSATPTISGTVFTKTAGIFGASYIGTVAGVYAMTVKIAGVHILGSPYSVRVLATSAEAVASRIISGPSVQGRVNIPTQVILQAYDRYHNRLGTAADDFIGVLPVEDRRNLLSTPLSAPVGDGKYSVSFLFTKAGTYQAIITLNSIQVWGSPVAMTIVSGLTTALQSKVNATDVARSPTVGSLFAFKIHAYDLFSNYRHEGGDTFEVRLLNPLFEPCPVCAFCMYGPRAVALENKQCVTTGGPVYTSVCDPCPSIESGSLDLGGIEPNRCFGYAANLVQNLAEARCYPGTYLGVMVFTKSGQYGLSVRFGGVSLQPDPLMLTVNPGIPIGRNSQVEEARMENGLLRPLSLATAGTAHIFMIRSHDLFMNPVETMAVGKGFRAVPVILGHSVGKPGIETIVGFWDADSEGSGLLRFQFILTVSSMYRIEVNVLEGGAMTEEVIQGSGFEVRTKPGVINASRSLSRGNGLSIATAGTVSSFKIISRDAFSNYKTWGSGASWSGSISLTSRAPHDSDTPAVADILVSSRDNLDGSFIIYYSTTRAGGYSLTATASTAPSVPLDGTPTQVGVYPGRAAAASTVVSGSGISSASVDGIANFTIHSYDAFGNSRTQGQESFTVMAHGGWTRALDSSTRATTHTKGMVRDLNNGSYVVTYYVTHAGNYSLHISLDAVAVSGSPFAAYVHSAATSIINCEPMIDIPIKLPAGRHTLQVLAKDRYGNPRTIASIDASRFTIDLRPSKSIENSTTSGGASDGAPAIYDMWYQLTTAGTYSLHIVYTTPAYNGPCISHHGWTDSKGVGCESYTSMPSNFSRLSANVSHFQAANASVTEFGVCGHDDETDAKKLALQKKIDTAMEDGVIGAEEQREIDLQQASLDASKQKAASVSCCVCGGGKIPHYPAQSWHISGSPLPVTIVPSSPTVSTFVATFPKFRNCLPEAGQSKAACTSIPHITTAGEFSTFMVHSRDIFGNYRVSPGLRLAVDVSGPAQTYGNVSDLGNGKYMATVKMSLSGQYKIAVIDITDLPEGGRGGGISGSPFLFHTVPTSLSVPHTTADGVALTYGEAGEDMTFTIQSKDYFANNRVHGYYESERNEFQGEWFRSNIDMRNNENPWVSAISKIKVIDSFAGSYKVILQVTASGNYALTVFQRDLTSFAGIQLLISGAPFAPCVQPGPAYPPNTVISGKDMAATIVGVVTSFSLQSYDRYGNMRTSGQDPLEVLLTLRPRSSKGKLVYINGTIVNHGFANYTVTYRVTISAQYMLDVKVYGLHVGAARSLRSPLRLFASADVIDASMTDVSGRGAETCMLDKVSQFVLTPRDSWGNALGSGASKIGMSLCTPASCISRPGEASIEILFYNRWTWSHMNVQKRYVDKVVKFQTSTGVVTVDILPRADGAFGIFFTVQEEGNYSVSVLVNKQHIRGSPLTLMAYQEDLTPNAAESLLIMDELLEWPAGKREAGVKFTGTLVTRNRFGVDLAYADSALVMVSTCAGVSSSCSAVKDDAYDISVRSNLDGTFAITLQITKSGYYTLQVFAKRSEEASFDAHVSASPFAVRVDASMPSSVTSMALLSSSRVYQAGFELLFEVQTRDRFGNDQTPDTYARFFPAMLTPKLILNGASVKTIWGSSSDQKNGKYIIRFPPVTLAAKYVLQVTDREFDVGRTPMPISVQPAQLSPKRSQALLTDSYVPILAGGEVLIKVSPRDMYSNPRTLPDDSARDAITIWAEYLPQEGNSSIATGPAPSALIPWRVEHARGSGLNDELPGLIDLWIGGTVVGRYLLHLEMKVGDGKSEEMANSPVVHEVRPGPAVGAMSHIQTVVPRASVAGDWIYIGLQPADAHGNEHKRPLGEHFEINIKGFSYLTTCGIVTSQQVTDALDQVPGQDCVLVIPRLDNSDNSPKTNASHVYSAHFFLTQSGKYNIDVSLISLTSSLSATDVKRKKAERLQGGGATQPFQLNILPGVVMPSRTVVTGKGATSFVAGARASFHIQARDKFSNMLSSGGDDIVCNMTLLPLGFNASAELFARGSVLPVLDELDGTYKVSYLLTVAGHYSILVAVRGKPGGVYVSVTGYPADASSPTFSGVALSQNGIPYDAMAISVGTTGILGTFRIYARDQFANARTLGGDAFSLEVAGPTLGETTVVDNEDGSYDCSYRVLTKGRYMLSVRLNGIHVGVLWHGTQGFKLVEASPFRYLDVYEVAPAFAAVVLSGSGLSQAIAGQKASFTLTAEDGLSTRTCCTGVGATGWVAEARKLEFGKEEFCDACWTQAEIVPSRPIQNQDALAQIRADTAGSWLLSVFSRIDGVAKHVIGSPFRVEVLPAECDPSKTRVSGAGISGVVLRRQGKVQVLTKDSFGNARTHPTLTYDDVQVWVPGSQTRYLQREASGHFIGKYATSYCGCIGCDRRNQGLNEPFTACVILPAEGGCGYACEDCRCYLDCACFTGVTQLNIKVKGQHIIGSPFDVTISEANSATAVSGSRLVSDVSNPVLAGTEVRLLVQIRDVDGRDKVSGGDVVTASVLRETTPGKVQEETVGQVEDLKDGTHLIKFVPKTATAHALRVRINGELIGMSRSNKARAGTNNELYLDLGAESSNDAYKDFAVLIDHGAGEGQLARITTYYGSNRIATALFKVSPDQTSYYTLLPSILHVSPGPLAPAKSLFFCGLLRDQTEYGSSMLPVPHISRGGPLLGVASCGIENGMASDRSEFFLQLHDVYDNALTTGANAHLSLTLRLLSVPADLSSELAYSFCSDSSRTEREQCTGHMAVYTCGDGTGLLYSTPTCSFFCAPGFCEMTYALERTWRNNDGHVRFSYAATKAGKYSVSVNLGVLESEQSLLSIPSRDVSSGPLDVRGAEIFGTVLTGAEAGEIAKFEIRVKDKFGNPVCSQKTCPPIPVLQLRLRQVGSQLESAGFAEFDKLESKYDCHYNTTLASSFLLTVSVYGVNLAESPYFLTIKPSQASAKHIDVELPDRYIAGVFNTLRLTAYDRFKNRLLKGGDEIFVRLDDVDSGTSQYANVIDEDNGRYMASFNSSTGGMKWLTVLLRIEPGFTTSIELVAGPAHPLSCSLLNTFRTDLKAGSSISLQIPMRDYLTNPVLVCSTQAYETAVITVSFTRSDVGDVVSNPDLVLACTQGVLSGTVGLEIAGEYVISLLLNGDHIAGSPFFTTVTAGGASAKYTKASSRFVNLNNGLGAQENAAAGSLSTLTLYTFDVFGNKALYDPFAEKEDIVVYLAAMGQRSLALT